MTQTPTQQTPTPQTPRVDSNSVLLRKMKLNVRKIEKVVKKNLGQQLTNKKDDDKNKKRLSLVLKEEELEKKKPNLLGKLGSKLKVKTGIFDSITNFMAWTFLGFVFTQIQPFLPKLGFLVGLLDGVASAIGWITTALVDTLSWFIKSGYDISDKLKGESDSIKKLPVNKELDKFTKTFDDTLDKTLKIAEDIANSNNPKSGEPPPTPPVKGAKSGGLITTRNNVPVNRPITREIKANRRTRLRVPTKQKTNEGAVGKDVGGENKVRDFYKSPRQKGGKLNRGPVESLSAASRAIRQSNSLFSDLAGSGVDIALGRKPANNVYVNTAKDVVALAQMINEKHDQNVKSNILGMAYGGTVDSSIKRISDKGNVVDLVATIIKKNVEDRVNKALSEMKTNVGRESAEMDKQRRISGLRGNYGISLNGQFYGPGGAPTPDEGFADEYGNVSKIEMGGLSQAEIRDLGKIIQAEAGGENDLGKAAVMNVILNRYRLIKSGKATPSAFGISGKRAKDVTITDIIVARNGKEFQPVRDGSFYRVSNNTGQAALEKAIKAGGNDPEKLMQQLKKSGKTAQEAEYVTRSVGFYNPSITPSSSIPFPTPTVSVGRHGFQQSANVKLTGKIGKMDATVTPKIKSMRVKGGLVPQNKFITSMPGWRWGRMHRGVDYAGAGIDDEPISVIKPGKVVATGNMGAAGYSVIIDHDDGTTTKYFHLKENSISVAAGQQIKPGQVIGIVGNTGTSTGTHLHFEVWKGNQHIGNPQDYAASYFRFGGNVIPDEVQVLAKKGGKEGYINYENKFVPQKWTDEQRKRFEGKDPKADKRKAELEEKAKEKAKKFPWRKPVLVNPTQDQLLNRIKNLNTIGDNNSFELKQNGKTIKIKRISSEEIELIGEKETGTVKIKEYEESIKNKKPIKITPKRAWWDPRNLAPAPSKQKTPTAPAKRPTKPSTRKPAPKPKPKTTPKPKPKRAWWDPRGWVGKKRGGLIGNGNQSIPSGYASYERPYGSFVVAIQPMIIQQTVPVDNPVVMPFPVATTVNSTLPQRG